MVTPPNGEPIAVFRHAGRLSAVTNLCAHQNGPLGEGRVIDGCITCPWHGYQYRLEDGIAPPPFTEKLATFRLRVVDGHVLDRSGAEPTRHIRRTGDPWHDAVLRRLVRPKRETRSAAFWHLVLAALIIGFGALAFGSGGDRRRSRRRRFYRRQGRHRRADRRSVSDDRHGAGPAHHRSVRRRQARRAG